MECDVLFINAGIVEPKYLPSKSGSGGSKLDLGPGFLGFKAGVISAIGTGNASADLIRSSARVIEGKGLAVLPGFVDSHIHVWKVGQLLTTVLDLRRVSSFVELQGSLLKLRSEKTLGRTGSSDAVSMNLYWQKVNCPKLKI